jgi:hypothetical protein
MGAPASLLLRRESIGWLGNSPCATGDPVAMHWGPKTDLGLYGSSYVGMLGALVRPASDPRILQLDCLATDFFRDKAYPTFLYYNPYAPAAQASSKRDARRAYHNVCRSSPRSSSDSA